MKTRQIAKQFQTICDLGIRNLIVGGCSFTYNNHDTVSVTWPYYLRDLCGFQEVYDFSMVGGGNTHTHHAMVYGLEKHSIDPDSSLVIIQVAGHDRDDYIVDAKTNDNDSFRYLYENEAALAISGGKKSLTTDKQHLSNSRISAAIFDFQDMKNHTSRSIENFVMLRSLATYLHFCRYPTVFFEYRDYTLPATDSNFDPREFLPMPCRDIYNDMITAMPHNFYKFCLQKNLMHTDDYHPSPDGHLIWTREVLVPWLSENISSVLAQHER